MKAAFTTFGLNPRQNQIEVLLRIYVELKKSFNKAKALASQNEEDDA